MARLGAIKLREEGTHGHREGKVTKMIERQTARIPSVGFLSLALGFIGLSAILQFATHSRKELGNFVGLWAPTILIMGLYNKLTKLEGSEK